MSSRIACFFIPAFPLAARLRSDPALKHQPLALIDGQGAAARVVAALPRVLEAGIMPGFSVPQARSLLPAIVSKPRDLEAERAAQEALLETAESFSPRVEEAEAGAVYLDLCGERNEDAFTERAVARAAKAGLPMRAAVAGGKNAARIAAEEAVHGALVVPPGQERAFIAPLPVERLRPQPALKETLGRWGVRTIGAFAALPEKEILRRLGKEGWELYRVALGIETQPLVPRPHQPGYHEGIELEWPVLEIEPFLQLARGLLERLAARLEASDLAIRKLEMNLKLDPLGNDARALPLPAPTRDVPTILNLLRLELEARPPAEPLIGIAFTALPERPRRAQLSLFDPPALSPDGLSATLTRLAALVGPDRVGRPAVVDGHRPEGYAMEPFAPPSPEERPREERWLFSEESAGYRPTVAVRVLRPRVELDVFLGDAATGRPASVRTRRNDGSQIEIVGTVRVASGPWRIEDGWWLGEPVLRDYWDVELSDGGLYRIFHDMRRNAWFADGVYD